MTEEEIDDRLTDAAEAWSVFAMATAITLMIELDPSLTMATFERRLRAIRNKTTYLIARPLVSFNNPELKSLRVQDDKETDVALWICLNGQREAEQVLALLTKTAKQNLVDLERCGFLVMRQKNV